METLFQRRSVRTFTQRAVSRSQLEQAVKAGMNAPSAMDQQPWQFCIIDDKNVFKAVMDVHPYASFLTQTPAAVLVCGDLSRERSEGYWPIDCAAATENILIELTEMGLGSCWIGIYPREKRMNALKEALQLPDYIIPFALTAVGYPAVQPEPKNLFYPERIHHNRW